MLSNGSGEFSGTSIFVIPAAISASVTASASSGRMPRRMAMISRFIAHSSAQLCIGGAEAIQRHVCRHLAIAGRDALRRQRGAIGVGEAACADDHHVAAQPVGPRGGKFRPDQQARQARRARPGIEPGQKLLRPKREQIARQRLGPRHRLRHGGGEELSASKPGRPPNGAAPSAPRAARTSRRS